MIDLHSHILPGIDDGARDLEDSVEMARDAAADGIEIVCATPHIRHDHDVRIEEIPERVAALNAELGERGVGVQVVGGGEVAATILDGLSDEELRAVSFGGRWILLEPAPGPLDDALNEAIVHLAERGFRSIVAHPERHPAFDLAERLAGLEAHGALIQMTAALIAEGDASEAMLDLARRGLVHVLGSDAHSTHFGRPLRLSPGLERLREVELIAPHLDWVAREAPAAVLRGEEIEPPYAAQI